ncbi:MAG: dihydrolipoamide acetyltransferase family protein [Terriglobales bacterium]
MPALEMGQETGKLVAWLKKDGDRVAKGEPLLEVETDKAVLEVEATADGTLAGITAQVEDVIPVGQTIAWILGPGEKVPREAAHFAAQNPSVPMAASSHAPTVTEHSASGGKISPKARRLAKEHGIDLNRIRGSGGDGEILTSDIQRLIDAKRAPAVAEASVTATPGDASASIVPSTTVSRIMAERTTQSWTTVPHFFLTRDVDAGSLLQARSELAAVVEGAPAVKITHTDFLVAAVAHALAKHPRMNASWNAGQVQLIEDVNVALAMAVGDGVVTATVRNADKLKLREIATHRRDLTERARAGKLHPADIAGTTFTISNLGMYQIDSFTAIIIPPQAGILAVGQIADRVVAVDGKPAVRPIMTLTLSCDHRVIDGAQGALFLGSVADAIREPEQWLE